LTFVPQLRAALLRGGGGNIMIVVGGVIPPQDFDALREAGVAAIFPPNTAVPEGAARLIEELNDRLGYRQKDVAE
jgi:methylmalonyl-CoA mutase